MLDVRPGPWLRLIAVGAAAAAALAVVSGAMSLHTAHRAIAALAVPPLAALVAAAWVAHRRLLAPSVAALGLFLAAALAVGRPLHIGFAALALAAALVATAELFSAMRDHPSFKGSFTPQSPAPSSVMHHASSTPVTRYRVLSNESATQRR